MFPDTVIVGTKPDPPKMVSGRQNQWPLVLGVAGGWTNQTR